MNTCLFRSGSILVWISLVPYNYVLTYVCIGKDTYYIRIRIYAQHLDIYVIVLVGVSLKVCNVWVFPER